MVRGNVRGEEADESVSMCVRARVIGAMADGCMGNCDVSTVGDVWKRKSRKRMTRQLVRNVRKSSAPLGDVQRARKEKAEQKRLYT